MTNSKEAMRDNDPRWVTEETHLPEHLLNATQFSPSLNKTAADRINLLEAENRALLLERDEAQSKLARVSDLRRDENTYVIPFEYDDDQPGILVTDLDAILDRPADAR